MQIRQGDRLQRHNAIIRKLRIHGLLKLRRARALLVHFRFRLLPGKNAGVIWQGRLACHGAAQAPLAILPCADRFTVWPRQQARRRRRRRLRDGRAGDGFKRAEQVIVQCRAAAGGLGQSAQIRLPALRADTAIFRLLPIDFKRFPKPGQGLIVTVQRHFRIADIHQKIGFNPRA